MAKVLTKAEIKKNLISRGTRGLKAFGFPNVNSKRILTDKVYKEFFQNMLEELKREGQGQETDKIIDGLLAVLRKEANIRN
jgi:formate dehydrogenase maturation protein FdhE